MWIGKFRITASRWPWQKGYNWHGMAESSAPLNPKLSSEQAAPRFGGGWKYKLGFAFSGKTLMIDLLFGMVRVEHLSFRHCPGCGKEVGQEHDEDCGHKNFFKRVSGWEKAK